MFKSFCKRAHDVGKKSEHSANVPTTWGRNRSTLQTSPWRGEEIGALCKHSYRIFAIEMMSAKTPAAVTSAPAPYPWIIMGYSW